MKIQLWIPQVICIVMLLWALNPENPYAYYILLRWVCCGIFAYLAFQASEQKKQRWVWVLGITALFYNPIFRVHLNRELWSIVNVVTIIILITSIVTENRNHRKNKGGSMKEKKTFYTRIPSVWWVFNKYMIWGAIFGLLIGIAFNNIIVTWKHQGPGIVHYRYDEGGDAQVSEEKYKRSEYTVNGFGLILGLVLWISLANSAKNEKDERAAYKDYMYAKINSYQVYIDVFAKVMGIKNFSSNSFRKVIEDPEYKDAQWDEYAKLEVYNGVAKGSKQT
jgi:hypothetical protein